MINWYQNFKNNIDFFLRNQFKVSREGFCIKNEDKECLFEKCSDNLRVEAFEKEKYLYEKYNLEHFKNNSTIIYYLLSLHILDMLEKNIDVNSNKDTLKVLDIGSKNWFYVHVLYNFFKAQSESEVELTGIELDAYRVYSSFYSRIDAAKFYMQNLDNTRYIAGDFMEHKDNYDYITWLYPFVTDYPLLKWGLPMGYFKPEKMLEHAYSSLNEGGQMIIVNQSEGEYEIQRKLFEKLKIPYEQKGMFESVVYSPEQQRFVSVVKK